MDNRHKRLAQALREAGITPAEAVERHSWSADTLKSNLSGVVHFGPKKAKEYAKSLGVRHEWLYYGTGEMRTSTQPKGRQPLAVPMVSWVSAGQLADTGQEITPEDDEWTLISGLPPSRYFATRVRGDSMDRYSPDSSVIIVDAEDSEPKPGRAYVFSVNGETTYKLYQDDPVIRLEPHSTNPFNRPVFIYEGQRWGVVGRVVRTMLDLP